MHDLEKVEPCAIATGPKNWFFRDTEIFAASNLGDISNVDDLVQKLDAEISPCGQ